MTGICGWFQPESLGAVDPALIAAMAEPLGRFDNAKARSVSAAFGAVAVAGPGPEVWRGDQTIAALWGRARFEDPDLAAHAAQHGLASALAQGYAKKKTEVLGALSGDFAAVVLDARSGDAMLATDRMGARPMCYATVNGSLIFGSTLDALAAYPWAGTPIDRQAIYEYVYFHMVPAPRTIRPGAQRLLPGMFLRWRGQRAETGRYWRMRYVEDDERPFAELKHSFVALLRDSVRAAANGGVVGTFLSGGTDSSTVAGMLGEVTGEAARTYSIGFEAQGYDEMHYARIAARHFGTRHHEYYVTPDDVVRAIPRIAAIHDQPFGNSSAVPTYYCAKLARDDGVDAMLGGDGGDELFGGNERYATQYLYSLYGDLPSALRTRLLDPVLGLLPAVGLFGKAQRYARNASMPMPARYDNYNLLERFGPENVFTAQFLAAVDRAQPTARMAEVYGGAQAGSLINRMLAFDLKYTLADNDLPKVARSCELAQVEARFPMLDDALVGFSARLAPGQKLRRTRLRHFFRNALRGFLPDEIIEKTKHGFGLPFGPWLQTHAALRAIVQDSLSDLKRRQIVRSQFIDELTSVHVPTHAKYYGTMVWVLMMLEQWLKEHETSRNRTAEALHEN
jgi:asparagine synthase (glutamine-hydrolysing)